MSVALSMIARPPPVVLTVGTTALAQQLATPQEHDPATASSTGQRALRRTSWTRSDAPPGGYGALTRNRADAEGVQGLPLRAYQKFPPVATSIKGLALYQFSNTYISAKDQRSPPPPIPSRTGGWPPPGEPTSEIRQKSSSQPSRCAFSEHR